MSSPRFVPILTTLALVGCAGPHTILEAPDPKANASARLDAYDDLAPAGQKDTMTVSHGTAVARTTDYIVLGDGRRVYHADDLRRVVDADSPTGRAAERSRRARNAKVTWAVVGGIVLAGASYFIVKAITTDHPEPGDPGFSEAIDDSGRNLGIGVGISFVSAVPFGLSAYYGSKEADERVSAFTTYEASLRRRLSLCVEGLQVIDCEAAPSAKR